MWLKNTDVNSEKISLSLEKLQMTMIVEFLLVSSNQNATNVYRLSAREKIRTLRNDATLECGPVPITPARNCFHLLTDLLVISHNGSLSTGNLYSMQPQIPN